MVEALLGPDDSGNDGGDKLGGGVMAALRISRPLRPGVDREPTEGLDGRRELVPDM